MKRSRWATAAVGAAVSVVISALAWWYFDTLVLFLLVPFIPLLLRPSRERGGTKGFRCPECGFRTDDPEYAYCPRDGTPLVSSTRGERGVEK